MGLDPTVGAYRKSLRISIRIFTSPSIFFKSYKSLTGEGAAVSLFAVYRSSVVTDLSGGEI